MRLFNRFALAVILVFTLIALSNAALAYHNAPYFLTVIEMDDRGRGRLSDDYKVQGYPDFDTCVGVGTLLIARVEDTDLKAIIACIHAASPAEFEWEVFNVIKLLGPNFITGYEL